MTWSEDSLHRWLSRRARPKDLVGALGHDASVLRHLRGRPVVCVDQTIEGVHFEPGADPRSIGRKAVARSLSDLAATAASPRAVWLALAAPRKREAWIRKLIGGAREVALEHGADLYGGDLASVGPRAHATVTALGEIGADRAPPGRERARAGQVVLVTGPLGGSRLGRHLAIEPRIAEGAWLHARGATAMIDVSDGLAWDLYRLARASRVRIDLDLARIPLHRDARRAARASGRTALDHALHDGEDHELVATIAAVDVERVLDAAVRMCPSLRAIGRVRAGRGLHLVDERGRARAWSVEQGGWKHGG